MAPHLLVFPAQLVSLRLSTFNLEGRWERHWAKNAVREEYTVYWDPPPTYNGIHVVDEGLRASAKVSSR
jgi:hypothetical protein